jgi:peptidoglycan/LPS O-acetylase OafA/YrhL
MSIDRTHPLVVTGEMTPASADATLVADGRDLNPGTHYLAFVDGLRAISILAVVAYHIGIPGVPGGFVGVDIFFVISGFLIVNQIKAGLAAGKFSTVVFYAQRALRILPPYLIVLLVTYALALFLLPTPEVSWDFLASAATAPLMVTNVVFYLNQGYFDISAIDKPLLHTWTLAVEEQFYLVAPLLVLLLFRVGKGRFGAAAILIGLALGVASLGSAIAETSTTGKNAAFYLAHCRAWEFIAGGFIGLQLVHEFRRLPAIVLELIAWLGAACIAIAIFAFDSALPYPSYNAVLPVLGASLIILCGLARPDNTVARFLAVRWMVAIGLISYSWYLWHWPILSFGRLARMSEPSLILDTLGGGLLAFVLAYLTYRYVERPIRFWRKSPGNLGHPGRIVLRFVAAAVAMSALGASAALAGYWSTQTYIASHYGIEGKGVLEAGCESKGGFADLCFEGRLGILGGDSHATVLFGTFAKRFDTLGIRLVSAARGGCSPLMLSPPERNHARRDDCARLIAPYERWLGQRDTPEFVIISGIWRYGKNTEGEITAMLSEISTRTRILLIGEVPIFNQSSLECVVLSDRYRTSRDRCTKPRHEIEEDFAQVAAVLKSIPSRFPNVRYIDPMNVFCNATVCSPFKDDVVFYDDSHHLSPAGADRLYDFYEKDFLWLAGKD